MTIRAREPRTPLALNGPEAQRVRALLEAGHGRPTILDTLRAEGLDVTERQVRTLYEHLREERRETRAAVQEQVVERAVAALAPGVPDDLQALQDVRDTMMLGMADCAKVKDWQTAASCASRATAAAKARLELAGVTPGATAPILSESDAAKILAEEFGDTGALKTDGRQPDPDLH